MAKNSKSKKPATKSEATGVIDAKYREKMANPDWVGQLLADHGTTDGKTDVKKLTAFAKLNDIDTGQWSHLNAGMVRMNLANALRKQVRLSGEIRTGKTTKTKAPKNWDVRKAA
jgi:hypothetical protein